MSDETANQASQAPDDSEIPSRRGRPWGTLRDAAARASQATGEAARRGGQAGGQLAEGALRATRQVVGKVQRRLGEDYYAIMAENPLVVHALSRSGLLEEQSELLWTAFNIPWATTLL